MIVWLASYPKSGNTWLRHLLACYRADDAVPINDLARSGAWPHDADPQLFAHVSDQPLTDVGPEALHGLRPAVHAHIARSAPDTVCVKTHNVAGFHNGQPMFAPELTAGAVYLARDPRAVAVSWAHHGQVSLDDSIDAMNTPRRVLGSTLDGGAEAPLTLVSTWSTHVASWRRFARLIPTLMVRYEDLIGDPMETLQAIARFLGHAPDPARTRRAIRRTSFARVQRDEAIQGFHEAPPGTTFFRQGTSDGWKNAMSRGQRRRIERAHHSTMETLGYV